MERSAPVPERHHALRLSRRQRLRAIGLVVAWLAAAVGCGSAGVDSRGGETEAGEVVVFTALDRVLSEPILERFEQETGIRVLARYDAESAKTTGLVNRILASPGDPPCDVFWSNELLQTVHLAEQGLLEPYRSPAASRFDARHRDPDDRWTAFAARARVIVYNTDRIDASSAPRSIDDFTDPRWRGRCAIALPFFGTTFAHMGMLRQRLGEAEVRAWLRGLVANDVAVAAGNGHVRDLVAAGEFDFGLTDTDDAHGGLLDGAPIAVVVPDAEDGAAVIPNTVALLAGAANPDAGRRLVDFLLSADVERRLAEGRGAQIPLGRDLRDTVRPWPTIQSGPEMPFDPTAAHVGRAALVDLLREANLDR